MDIPTLLSSYIKDNNLKQYQIADQINDAFGFQYITPMAISHWINGTYLPDVKTVKVVQATTNGKLRILFDEIMKELDAIEIAN